MAAVFWLKRAGLPAPLDPFDASVFEFIVGKRFEAWRLLAYSNLRLEKNPSLISGLIRSAYSIA